MSFHRSDIGILLACPTARGAVFKTFAIAPYVVTLPFGTNLHTWAKAANVREPASSY